MSNIIIEEPNPFKNRPSSSSFKQQRLNAWQPILTAGTVLPTFLIIACLFIPIGFGLLTTSSQVQELIIDYTYCKEMNGNDTCADKVKNFPLINCTCKINFTIEKNFKRDVFVYYRLTNFYQNHRRYVKSRDDKQLLGNPESLSKDCSPFDVRLVNNKLTPIVPCGAIANSIFNDTIQMDRLEDNGAARPIKFLFTGIAWSTDKKNKFSNPKDGDLTKIYENYANPPNWGNRTIYNLDTNDIHNNGFINEPFIVWMRTAALPSFRKIYARVDHSSEEVVKTSLPMGSYLLTIVYNYPVSTFKGTKSVIISNTSWLGGRNPFLGIAYIIVGFLCLILFVVFLFIHKKYGKSTSDLINVTQRTPFVN